MSTSEGPLSGLQTPPELQAIPMAGINVEGDRDVTRFADASRADQSEAIAEDR